LIVATILDARGIRGLDEIERNGRKSGFPACSPGGAEGRLPRGIDVERLRDPPTEWGKQFEMLGL
jgi:hypothetical protein